MGSASNRTTSPLSRCVTYAGADTGDAVLLNIHNPLPDRTMTLTRIVLRTQGSGAYSLRADDTINFTINGDSSATINLSSNGSSKGGFMQSSEPVDLLVRLWLTPKDGEPFVKQFVQHLSQD